MRRPAKYSSSSRRTGSRRPGASTIRARRARRARGPRRAPPLSVGQAREPARCAATSGRAAILHRRSSAARRRRRARRRGGRGRSAAGLMPSAAARARSSAAGRAAGAAAAARAARSCRHAAAPCAASCRPSCARAPGGLLGAAQRRGDLGVAPGRRRSAAGRAARCLGGSVADARPTAAVVGAAGASRRRAPRARSPTGTAPARPRAVVVERLAVGDRQHPGAQVRVRRAGSGRRAAPPGTSPGSSRRRRRARRTRRGSASTASRWLVEEALEGRRGHATAARRAGRAIVRSPSAHVVARCEARGPWRARVALEHEPAQQRRRAVALLAALLAQRVEHRRRRGRGRSRRPTRAGRAGGSARAPCPASMSAGAADALADARTRPR